jgi:hypothetical protein
LTRYVVPCSHIDGLHDALYLEIFRPAYTQVSSLPGVHIRVCIQGANPGVQGSCSHKGRWKSRHAADRDEENLAAFGSGNVLLVLIPVDLAWSNLACKVRLPLLYLLPCRMQQCAPRYKVIGTQQEVTFTKHGPGHSAHCLPDTSLSCVCIAGGGQAHYGHQAHTPCHLWLCCSRRDDGAGGALRRR